MQTLADMIRERPSAIAESLDNARDDLSRAGFRDISTEICDADDWKRCASTAKSRDSGLRLAGKYPPDRLPACQHAEPGGQ